MNNAWVGLSGALGSVAFFGWLAFHSWTEYLKNKDEREAAHKERMKALELGYPQLDGEIERAKAYASAAWAAGLIGLLVPLAVISLATVGTIVAVLWREPGENQLAGLIVAWSIGAVLALVCVVRGLGTIRQLPRPVGDAPPRKPPAEKREKIASTDFQAKSLEL
jgi:hypothetical protein